LYCVVSSGKSSILQLNAKDEKKELFVLLQKIVSNNLNNKLIFKKNDSKYEYPLFSLIYFKIDSESYLLVSVMLKQV